MTKEENIAMLRQVLKDTTDPHMKKDIQAKLKALEDNKTIDK